MSPDESVPAFFSHDPENTPMPTQSATRITRQVSEALLDSEAALERVLAALERQKQARLATCAWDNIGECNRRLARYLTEAYPDRRGGSLLANTLAEAFCAYESAEPGAETAPARAYLQGLLACAPRILAFDLFGRRADGRTVRWVPFAEPVADWAREQVLSELIFEPAHAARRKLSTHECVRWILCARVLRFEDVALLQGELLPPAPVAAPRGARVSYLKRVR
jgi:hypothetical protein